MLTVCGHWWSPEIPTLNAALEAARQALDAAEINLRKIYERKDDGD